MAAASQRTNRPWKMLPFALLLIALLLNEVTAQDEGGRGPQDSIRGDNIVKKTEAPVTANPQGQNIVFPTLLAAITITPQDHDSDVPVPTASVPEGTADQGTKATAEVKTDKPIEKPETPVPDPPRGDNSNKPKPKPKQDVVCVSKEDVEGKNAVQLILKASSDCNKTQMWITSILPELCAEDCKLELYQKDDTKEVLVSGKYVEDDIIGMTNKLNNVNIKDKINVEEANPRWEKNTKLVLVSLLLAGLLLAVLLVVGYYCKTHHKNSKGVRLADSFQVDEENQANTLVSVAPLPQEPVDKPTINGESPPENGTNSPPTTNGHSANQTQVADTEM